MRPPAFCRLDAAPALGIEALAARFYGHAYDRHFHDGFAVGLTEDGRQAFHVRGARHVSTPGTAIVLMPGDVHDGEAHDAAGFAYRMLYLPQALVAEVLADAAERLVGLPHFPAPLLSDRRLGRAVAALAAALEQPTDALTLHHLVTRLVLALGRSAPALATAEAPVAAIARIRALLHAHLDQPLTIEQLAAEAGIGRFRLTRAFTRACGLPPHAYRMSLRLNRARQLLSTGETPAAVAAACGFVDQAHLTREFRRRVGVTPGVYVRAVARGSIGT